MISQEVRNVVDEVHDLEDKNAAHQKAWDLMQAQLDALKAQVAGAPSLSPEDKDALTTSVNEMKTVADSLVHAVPANTDMAQPDAPKTKDDGSEDTTDQQPDPTTDPTAPSATASASAKKGKTN